jgi:hypothetical protein
MTAVILREVRSAAADEMENSMELDVLSVRKAESAGSSEVKTSSAHTTHVERSSSEFLENPGCAAARGELSNRGAAPGTSDGDRSRPEGRASGA